MHLTLSHILLTLTTLPALTSASVSSKPNDPIPNPNLNPTEAAQYQPPIPAPLQQFIAQFNSFHPAPALPLSPNDNPNNNNNNNPINKRQRGVGGADTKPPTTTIATQMSPVTTYMAHGKPVVFTQTFKPTPDPWGSVVVGEGEIGFGRGA